MRLLVVSVLGVLVATTALVVGPTVTARAADPRPVTSSLQQIALDTVSAAGRRTAAVPGAGRRAPTLLSAELPTRPFSLMGLTWQVDPAVDDVAVWVRNRTGGSWSGWESIEPNTDDVPDAGSPDTTSGLRSGTVPVWTGPSDGVQVRLDRVSGAAPRDVRIQLIDPGTSPADDNPPAPRASAGAAQPRPDLITRAEWGADESIRRGPTLYNSTVKVGFVHHTASSNNYSSSQAAAMVRGIYAYHVKSNGWGDIGYNYLVDRYGRAYEGRAGGLDRYVVGAHTGGFNTSSFGVSLLGDFSTVAPPQVALDTLSKVLAWKLGSAYRDPLGQATLTSAGGGTSKFRAGTSHVFDVVSGHRDAGETTCPGAQTYARMDDIRAAVKADLGAGFADPATEGGNRLPLGTTGEVALRASVVGETSWTGTVATARGELLRTVSGTGGTAEITWDLRDASGAPAGPGAYVLRLTAVADGESALELRRTVVIAAVSCRGSALERARCRGLLRDAGR